MSAQHFAIEVEQDLLGALMAHQGAIEKIEADLQPSHFYRAEHQAIYAAIASLTNQGRSCDSMAVVDALEQSGQLERRVGSRQSSSLRPKAHPQQTCVGTQRSSSSALWLASLSPPRTRSR
ncbi:DnaB-like helicase N-terminal domain-containing protein [Thauera humireducens]|uniref:DnaB-like helicase N-terminal domain-containing protein n=1 Tax=Thauera humireducens TaxID=1134435 RepID=UPI00312013AD